MKNSGLPLPEFSQKETNHFSVKVVLRNNIEHRKIWLDADVSSLVGEMLFKKLDTFEKRIINFVAEHKAIGSSQVQRLTGLSWPASKKLLDGLVKKEILRFHKRPSLKQRDPKARYYLEIE